MATYNERNETGSYLLIEGFDKNIRINWINIYYTASSTTGDRQLVLDLLNEDDEVVFYMPAGNVQSASDTKNYTYLPGVYRETTAEHDSFLVPIPPELIVMSNWKIRLEDENQVHIAGDVMTTDMQYSDYYHGQ